jgi:hypothetical protein
MSVESPNTVPACAQSHIVRDRVESDQGPLIVFSGQLGVQTAKTPTDMWFAIDTWWECPDVRHAGSVT